MAIKLKQSTASQEIPLGYFVDSADGDTAETALTIANTDIKIWKMGATTLADKNSGGATHIAGGVYYAVLDATDTNTLGGLVVFVHVSGALAVRVECEVLPANIYDSYIAGTDLFDVSVTQILGTAVSTPATAGILDVNVKNIDNDAASASGTVTFPNATLASTTNITAGTIATVTNLTNAPTNGDLTTAMKASVNAEVVDTLATDTYAELGAVPAGTSTIANKLNWLFALARNKITQTATTQTLRNDADSGNIATSTDSDTGTTYTRGEWS